MSETPTVRPWADEERFREEFIRDGKSTTELAEEWGCTRQTIYRWRERHGIDQHDGKPWSDEGRLREVLVDEGRSPYDLADEWGCYAQTIYKWMRKFGIEPSAKLSRGDVRFYTNCHGYESVYHRGQSFALHRLVAVAEYGFEAVAEADAVHHETEVPWDNRPSKLTPMTDAEHRAHHNRQRAGATD